MHATRTFKTEADDQDDYYVGSSTVTSSGISMLTILIGASVVGYPALFAKVGIVYGTTLLLFSCGMSIYVCGLLAEACALAHKSRGRQLNKLEELGSECYGNVGRNLVRVFVNALFLAKICIYLVLIGKNLTYLFPVLPYRAWILLVTGIAIPIAFMRDMSVVERFAILGVVASVMYFFLLLSSSIKSSNNPFPYRSFELMGLVGGPYDELKAFEDEWNVMGASPISSCASALAVMIFGFAPVDVLATIRREMMEPERLPTSILGSHVAACAIYFVAGVIGFWGFGMDANGNATLSMCDLPGCKGEIDWPNKMVPISEDAEGSKWIEGYLLAGAVIVNLLVTIPIVLYCFFSGIESMYTSAEPMGQTLNTALRVIVPIGCAIVALCIPFFLQVVQILSTGILVPLAFGFPVIFSWKMAKDSGSPQGPYTVAFGVFTLILGALVFVIGLIDAFADLSNVIEKYPEQADLFGNFWN